MFSLLFGASEVLILEQYTKGSSPDSAADFYFRRLLFLFGLFNAYILLWQGNILFACAVAGIFIFPLHKLPVKRLLKVAAFVMIFFTL